MMHVLVTLIFGITTVAAAPSNNARIVGGTPATVNVYAQIAALLYSEGSSGFRQTCGGTIINNRSILTAAHCTYRDLPTRWQTRVGSSFANSGGTVRPTSTIFSHPNYNWRTDENDIAIIQAANDVAFSDFIRPGNLAGPSQNIADDTLLYAIGWGVTSFGGTAPEQLRQSLTWTVNQFICRERYSELKRIITDDMLCTGDLDVGGRGQCSGDAGGPVMNSIGMVFGVYSFSEQCGHARYPAVNTRVSNYAAWIQANA